MSRWSEDGTNYLQQLATCLSVLSMSRYGSSDGPLVFCSSARHWVCDVSEESKKASREA